MSEFNAKEYWETRLKKNYGLHGVGYLGHGKSYNKWMYKVRKFIFNKYTPKFKELYTSPSVLDIGSGTGFYIDLWKELGVGSLTGSDLTQTAIDNLKAKYKDCSFIESDISADLKVFQGQKFDIISAFDVLFHIVDDGKFEAAIQNIYHLLNAKGLFIVSDNFIHVPTNKSTHHANRSLENFTAVLNKFGFEIILRKPSFYFLNAPVDTNSKLLKKFWAFQSKIIYRGEFYGNLVGAFLYPIEIFILQFLKEGPSTEIMVCKKK